MLQKENTHLPKVVTNANTTTQSGNDYGSHSSSPFFEKQMDSQFYKNLTFRG
jgi:hypothetical protein